MSHHTPNTTHPSSADLMVKYSPQGLDIVEMRGIWAMVPKTFNNDGDGKKKDWRDAFKQKLRNMGKKADSGNLDKGELRHR